MARDINGGTNRWAVAVFNSSTTAFAVQCWAKIDGTQGSGWKLLKNGTTTTGYGFDFSAADQNVQAINENLGRFGGQVMTTGVWYHLLLQRTGGTTTFYVNGASNGTSGTAPNAPTGNFELGDSTASFDGKVCEVAFWSAAISTAEVAALAKGVPVSVVRRDLLVGYWPLWGSGSPEADLSGGGRNLTLTGTSVQIEHAPVGKLVASVA